MYSVEPTFKLSKGSGKMQGIPSINSSPLGNPFCVAMAQDEDNICSSCYSQRLCQIRPSADKRFREQGETLSTIDKEEIVFPAELRTTTNVRIHSHGEIINQRHADNLLYIVQENPHTLFTWFTKRKNLVNRSIKENGKPDNLILIYSEPAKNAGTAFVPEHFDKVFMVTKKPTLGFICKGRCIDCMVCYSHNDRTLVSEKQK